MLYRDIEGLKKVRHNRVHDFLGGLVLLVNDLKQATLFYRACKNNDQTPVRCSEQWRKCQGILYKQLKHEKSRTYEFYIKLIISRIFFFKNLWQEHRGTFSFAQSKQAKIYLSISDTAFNLELGHIYAICNFYKKKKASMKLPLKAEQFRQIVFLRHLSEIFFFKPLFCR